MSNVSPGVYSKIIDLSNYVQAVPSTIGCIMALTKKGRDNQFLFIGSRAELISEFGEPDIRDYGKNYGQGLYEAYNFLGESGALYFQRCLPNNATYGHIKIDVQYGPLDSTAAVIVSYCSASLNTINEIRSNLEKVGNTYPLCIIRPIGRGDYYNAISVRITEHANQMFNGVYVLDVYEKQSDGDEVIVESFEVSFDPKATDRSGDSIFISHILNMYSSYLRCEMEQTESTEEEVVYAPGYDIVAKVYDKEIGSVSVDKTLGVLFDNKQDFGDWQTDPESGNADYVVIAKDAKGNSLYGWLGLATGTLQDSINVWNGRDLDIASRGWTCNDPDVIPEGETTSNLTRALAAFDEETIITYEIRQSFTSIADAFLSDTPVPIKKGSDGDLLDASGRFVQSEGEFALVQGYAGLLTNPATGQIEDSITDTENFYFTMVFDAGYTSNVKTTISTLVQTRRDCIALLDNGDNPTFTAAMTKRQKDHKFNNFYCALYECYNKVYDVFTGANIWVSPLYHMSYLFPRNDNVAEIWYAAAGFNRGAIDTIKDLRYNVKLGQRDQFYLNQINDIVRFSSGYVVWSQLTTQAKPSALQDINIVRLVLYCKRAIEQFAKFYIFELNDEITWNSFNSQVINFLEEVKKKRGLYSYSVETSATEYERKRKIFHCDMILEPTRVVEQIHLNFFIK